MNKSNSNTHYSSGVYFVILFVVILFTTMNINAQNIVVSPIVYGKTATFSVVVQDSLPDKIFTVSNVVPSCPCIQARFVRTSRGVYTVSGVITTDGFGKGLQEKRLYIRTNNWNQPVRTVTVKYFVIDTAERIAIRAVIPPQSNEYSELQDYFSQIFTTYGEALDIQLIEGTPARLMIRSQVYTDMQMFKLALITELTQKYPYLDEVLLQKK